MTGHRVSIEIDANSVGQAFAHTDDKAQAEMLNAMGRELFVCCGGDAEMQICYLSGHLDNKGKEMIKAINEFIIHRESEATK